ERLRFHEHTSACCGGQAAIGSANPCEWKKHLEKINKGRHVDPLGKTLAMELRHQRRKHEPTTLRSRDELGNGVGRMDDISIGQQQIFWLQSSCNGDALLHSP